QIVRGWTSDEREALRRGVPRTGLKTPIRGRTVGDIAAEVVELARQGLTRRGNRNHAGEDETIYLRPIEATLALQKTPADVALEQYESEWHGDIERIFERNAYWTSQADIRPA